MKIALGALCACLVTVGLLGLELGATFFQLASISKGTRLTLVEWPAKG